VFFLLGLFLKNPGGLFWVVFFTTTLPRLPTINKCNLTSRCIELDSDAMVQR